MPETLKQTRLFRFDEMAVQVKDKIDNPAEADVDRYVGLEHIDPESLKIQRWGKTTDVESSKIIFKAGDIIFGKRRAYQRKLAVADFDGICSAHAMVLRPKTDVVLEEFLPFLMQSDIFMDRAVKISVGGLSPTINWGDLAREKFALPSLEEQRRIAVVLQAAESYRNHLRSLARSAQVLFQSTVDRWFPAKSQIESEHVHLADICHKISDGVHKKPDYVETGVPFLTVENLTKGPRIDFTETRFVTQEDHVEFCKRTKPERGDVLLTKDGTLGVPRVVEVDTEFSIFVSLALVKPKEELLDPWYLRYYFDSSLFKKHVASRAAGSALKHIHLVDLRASPLPAKGIEEQQEIAESISTVYRAYRAALGRFDSSHNVLRAVMAHVAAARV